MKRVIAICLTVLMMVSLCACEKTKKVYLPTALDDERMGIVIDYNEDGTISSVSDSNIGFNELSASFEYNPNERAIEVKVSYDGEEDNQLLFSYTCDSKGRPWRGTVYDLESGILGWHLDHTYDEETGRLIEILITPGAYVIENHVANWEEDDCIIYCYGENSEGQLGYEDIYGQLGDSSVLVSSYGNFVYDSIYTITFNYNLSSGNYTEQSDNYNATMSDFVIEDDCVFDVMSLLSIIDATSLVYSAG